MSVLNSIFNRTTFVTRCKTYCNLAISRIKLLRNKREAQLKHMHKEIFDYLQSGQEAVARIRVEHIIREENIMAAYEILELFCEFVLARAPILESKKECPVELQEAIASIIFASPRCSDLPELMQIRNLFTIKYGKEFVLAASELRPDSNVNRLIIEKLSAKAPSTEVRLKALKGIAKEFNLEWDSSNTAAEFSKQHEDLLDGSVPVTSQDRSTERSPVIPIPQKGPSVSPKISTTSTLEPVVKKTEINSNDERLSATYRSSDVLDKAQEALAAAARATAAARAAAKLVDIRVPWQPSNGQNSS